MNVEISHIHEDYVTTTNFTLMLLNGLLVLVAPNIRNHAIEEMSKEELNVFLRSFCTSAWKKDGTLSV